MTGSVKECREDETWESWRVQVIKEVLRGQLLRALAEGTRGTATKALGGFGALWGHASLDAQWDFLVLHTCGTEIHAIDVDG